MKKQNILLILFVLFGFVGFCMINSFSTFRFYKSVEFKQYRIFLGKELQRYYTLYYSTPNSIDDFISFLENETDKSTRFYESSMKILKNNKDQLRTKLVKNEHLFNIYDIGFDEIDDQLNTKVINLDSISFAKYLFKPKGDILISWVQFLDICEGEKFILDYYRNGINFKSKLVDSILRNQIGQPVNTYINDNYPELKTVNLLFSLVNKNNRWQIKLICNWHNYDTSFINHFKAVIQKAANRTMLSEHVDSLYFPVYYNKQSTHLRALNPKKRKKLATLPVSFNRQKSN